MGNIDVAVVLLRQDILADLIAIQEFSLKLEVEDEVDQLFLGGLVGGLSVDGALTE